MNAFSNNQSSSAGENNLFKKNDSKLPKLIGAIIVSAVFVLGSIELFSFYEKTKAQELAQKNDFYQAVGGRTYEGFVLGYGFDEETKEIQYIELLGSDTPIFLNHPELPVTTLRNKELIVGMNDVIYKALESDETRYLRVDVTHYFNKTKNDRINVMMSTAIIPPIAAPKVDMDKERTIFRHPDTYEVIPKYMYDEIMAERKEKEDFKNEVLESLNEKPNSLSRYTKKLSN